MTGSYISGINPCGEVTKPAVVCNDPKRCPRKILVILGASARAAAVSAHRAGFVPAAADLFGDRDLRQVAKWIRIQDYPLGILAASCQLPPGDWLYTGGLENHPDLVDRVAATRTLLGNPGKVLRAVRDPFRLHARLTEQGWDSPPVRSEASASNPQQRWLIKPRHSCGGRGIRVLPSNLNEAVPLPEDSGFFFQQLVDGPSYSAVFIAANRRASLIGVSRQLVGQWWTNASPFAYCGSLWPPQLNEMLRRLVTRLGECLAETFHLTGIFGVDFVLHDDRIFVLEVNPRLVASAELLEQAFAVPQSIIRFHVDACRTGDLPAEPEMQGQASFGKAILFARTDTAIGPRFEQLLARMNTGQTWPPLADLPGAGSFIPSGQPILTIRAEATTPGDAYNRLRQMAQRVRSALDVN